MTVTPAQVAAAQLQLELAVELGEDVSPAVRAIAQAKRVTASPGLSAGSTEAWESRLKAGQAAFAKALAAKQSETAVTDHVAVTEDVTSSPTGSGSTQPRK